MTPIVLLEVLLRAIASKYRSVTLSYYNNIINTDRVDSPDCAQAIQLALEYTSKGFDTFIIAAADMIITQSNKELLAKYFPGVPRRRKLRLHESMLSSDKAKRMLGYQPQFSWRNEQVQSSGKE